MRQLNEQWVVVLGACEEPAMVMCDGSVVFECVRPDCEDDATLASAAPNLVRALLAVEWVEDDEGGEYCPACEWERGTTEVHGSDCRLDAALRKAGAR